MHASRLVSAYLCIYAIHTSCCNVGSSFAFTKILICLLRSRGAIIAEFLQTLITSSKNAVIFALGIAIFRKICSDPKSLLRIFSVLTFEQISWVLFLVTILTQKIWSY